MNTMYRYMYSGIVMEDPVTGTRYRIFEPYKSEMEFFSSEMFEPYLDGKRRARRFQRGIVRLQQSSFSLHFDSRLFAALHTVVWGDYPHQAILRERGTFFYPQMSSSDRKNR